MFPHTSLITKVNGDMNGDAISKGWHSFMSVPGMRSGIYKNKATVKSLWSIFSKDFYIMVYKVVSGELYFIFILFV